MLILSQCSPWSGTYKNNDKSFSIQYKYKYDKQYIYKDAVGVSRSYWENPTYKFYNVDIKLTWLKSDPSEEIPYLIVALLVKEKNTNDELIIEPGAVDCGFLCVHEIFFPNLLKILPASFIFSQENDTKPFELVYVIPYDYQIWKVVIGSRCF